ncbi:hypothetical protein BD626DRAFT_567456 [Schizophyllum amplum]|uniref:Uncharacterized protein n=1 Tax=Schizophyllum amplum TaxID=97359 RepID=A0A550CL68_9AGAR|nr:hypothetical protein BD626DRAFT_567456 [Auriculariopsis ampla]
MPRGIPNARRDETGMKYTTFHVPLPPNPKYSSSTYSSQKRRRSDQPRGHQTLVIHPGTQNFRIGRASDLSPVVIPAIVARKTSAPVPRPTARCRVPRPADPNEPISPNTADPTLSAIAAIQNTLYSYMSYLNIPGDPNAARVQYLADPPASGYSVKQPIHGVNFNADYPSLQAVLADIDLIIRETLRTSFDITRATTM